MRFRNRQEAGQRLVPLLAAYRDRSDALVLALPRGGVPVAAEIARALRLPLDVLAVRKLGIPGRPECAMGAIGPGGVRVMRLDAPAHGIPAADVAGVVAREEAELERRAQLYRNGLPPLDLAGRTAILVDDGLATGATMQAALQAARQAGAAHAVAAVPVGDAAACAALRPLADAVVCALAPHALRAVGLWYEDFAQLTDREVWQALASARAQAAVAGRADGPRDAAGASAPNAVGPQGAAATGGARSPAARHRWSRAWS
ncbi:MAG: phosphoribosyltransferase family protein [Xylophilus ampelinus]